jgi:hypothetical protein
MVANISTFIVGAPALCRVSNSVSELRNTEATKPVVTGLTSGLTLSALSRQLADSAVRAEHRDSTLSRKQLAELAGQLNEQISGDSYFANKTKHDNEVPNTSDPELLARAKSATDFVNLPTKWDQTVKNPFAGLSSDQLTLIAYDDSGSYTVNERRAASYGAYRIEQDWKKKVCDMMMDEYSRTGEAETPKVLAELLSHYRTLPRIEQAQHPEGYEACLQSKLGPDALTTNN